MIVCPICGHPTSEHKGSEMSEYTFCKHGTCNCMILNQSRENWHM